MQMNRSKAFTLCLLLGAAGEAHAYIDPGSGSALIQGLIASVALAGVMLRAYWYSVVAFFRSKRRNDAEAVNDD